MKKLFYMMCASVALVVVVLACSKEIEEINTNEEGNATITGKVVSFTVSVEDSSTKATLSSSTNFEWESTDRAAVYSNEGEKVLLTPSSISGGSATFTGTLTSGTDYIPEGALVVFPAERLASATTVTFPASYSSTAETQGPTLAAKVSSKTLAFKYLAATVKVTITDVPYGTDNFYINTRNAANSDDVICTGTFTVDFSGDNPSLTSPSSTGNNITITNTSGGSKTIFIPLPTNSEQKLYLDVKYGAGVLYSKAISFTSANAITRNMFVNMPTLTINPDVYMVSDMTSWTDGNKVQMTRVGTEASITLNALGGKHWRPIVVMPNGYWIYYGFTSYDSSLTSGTFNNITGVGDKKSALVNSSTGNYTLNFNYTTGAYSSSSNSTYENLYIGDSAGSSLQEMRKLTKTLAYTVKQYGSGTGTLYGYYNNYSASQGGNYKVDSENYYLWVYNFSTNTMTATWFNYNTAKSWGVVNLYGSFDGWTAIGSGGGLAFTNISGTPAWYLDVDWASETTFRFNGLSITDLPYDDANEYLSSYKPSVTKIDNDGYGNTNFKVAAGKYTIIFYENQKWTILNRE